MDHRYRGRIPRDEYGARSRYWAEDSSDLFEERSFFPRASRFHYSSDRRPSHHSFRYMYSPIAESRGLDPFMISSYSASSFPSTLRDRLDRRAGRRYSDLSTLFQSMYESELEMTSSGFGTSFANRSYHSPQRERWYPHSPRSRNFPSRRFMRNDFENEDLYEDPLNTHQSHWRSEQTSRSPSYPSYRTSSWFDEYDNYNTYGHRGDYGSCFDGYDEFDDEFEDLTYPQHGLGF